MATTIKPAEEISAKAKERGEAMREIRKSRHMNGTVKIFTPDEWEREKAYVRKNFGYKKLTVSQEQLAYLMNETAKQEGISIGTVTVIKVSAWENGAEISFDEIDVFKSAMRTNKGDDDLLNRLVGEERSAAQNQDSSIDVGEEVERTDVREKGKFEQKLFDLVEGIKNGKKHGNYSAIQRVIAEKIEGRELGIKKRGTCRTDTIQNYRVGKRSTSANTFVRDAEKIVDALVELKFIEANKKEEWMAAAREDHENARASRPSGSAAGAETVGAGRGTRSTH